MDEVSISGGRRPPIYQSQVWLLSFLTNFLFLATGVAQSLISFRMDAGGVGSQPACALLMVAQPLGQTLLVLCLPTLWTQLRFRHVRSALPAAGMDLAGCICMQVSIAVSGSGFFMICYSFITPYTAIVQLIFRGKRISLRQWLSIGIIVASIILTAVDQLSDIRGVSTTWGIVFAMGAVLSFGSNYVFENALLRSGDSFPIPALSFCVGLPQLVVQAVYFASYVLPHWDELIIIPMQNAKQPLSLPVVWFAAVTFNNGIHQLSFYGILTLGDVAAVTAGVNKALQSASVFVLSGVFFCSSNRDQCITKIKVFGVVGVCIGVLSYTFATLRAPSNQCLVAAEVEDSSHC